MEAENPTPEPLQHNWAADIQCLTWLQSRKTQKYWLIITCRWGFDAVADRWAPTTIELLEFKTCTPEPTEWHDLVKWLQTGSMAIVAKPENIEQDIEV
jgi:hypothetical protein